MLELLESSKSSLSGLPSNRKSDRADAALYIEQVRRRSMREINFV